MEGRDGGWQMNRISQFLALGGVAALGLALAVVIAPDGRAAVSSAALAVSHTADDIDHAHRAFDRFRNRLDAAPRRAATLDGDCARFAWPHIPQSCQTSPQGEHRRPVRLVALDQTSR
ncbi:MAG: hypothetical protein Q8O26_08335 [Phreatobacter sp.]|uniref:hypothetical protein n=1 Tax=Phreatobacter sp. TaxID=1966341 RepID=UPI002734EF3B|nr:hypothetical protein [Phreatobacter sp.]MDP2801874.1 hypothetical protein [Phreatobacter sp.]